MNKENLLAFAKYYRNSLHQNVSFDSIRAVEDFLANWLEAGPSFRHENAELMATFSDAMTEIDDFNYIGTVYRGFTFTTLDNSEQTDSIIRKTREQTIISTSDLVFIGEFFATITNDEYECAPFNCEYGAVFELEITRGFNLAEFMIEYYDIALSNSVAETMHSYFGENEILVRPEYIENMHLLKGVHFKKH